MCAHPLLCTSAAQGNAFVTIGQTEYPVAPGTKYPEAKKFLEEELNGRQLRYIMGPDKVPQYGEAFVFKPGQRFTGVLQEQPVGEYRSVPYFLHRAFEKVSA